jgi:endonuclease/exonuclease/phosphatase family metal-dependent hydrolase
VDEELVVVLGDLNDTPDSTPLRPLVGWTELRDVSTHQSFDPASFPGLEDKTGTYDLGNPNQKIDCLLMSPALFGRIDSCGLFRKGAWPGSCPPRWEVYPELQEKIHVASDHHVIWAEID